MTNTEAEPARPVNLSIKRAEQELHIRWSDGVQSIISAAVLRRHCPCAPCRGEREQANPLRVLSVTSDEPIRLTGGKIMGNYALQLVWSDGHDTGIYDFRTLQKLAAVTK